MKKFYIEILLLAMTMSVFAEQRSVEEAAQIAAQFTSAASSQKNSRTTKKNTRKAIDASEMRLIHQVAKPNSNEPALYVFNKPEGGWVIVSADDQSTAILGYSEKGTFDGTKENVAFMLNHYAEDIAYARPLTEAERTQRKAKARKAADTDVEPLLAIEGGEGIKWNQDAPYYNMCPIDRYSNEHSATGCVATAAAIVMRFWRWPVQGIGEYSYVWNNKFDYDESIHNPIAGFDTVLYANFGATTYDWDNMLLEYHSGEYNQAQANAVAQLMYHAGVVCRMDYGGYAVGGSGSGGHECGQGMIDFLRYKAIKHFSQGEDCDFDTITKYFSLDLHAGRPVMMGGGPRSGSGSGHAFVCDGMKDFDGQMLYHINWGWGGQSDGYFVITTLDPDEQGIGGNDAAGGFASGIGFWYGLEPDRNPTLVTGISLDKNILSMNVGEKKELVATIAPADASSQGMYWTSSNESIATVDYKGKVKGISAGSAIITVKSADGGYTASCNVTVSDGPAVFDTINITFNSGVFEHKYSTSDNNISIGLDGTEGDYYPYMWFQFNGDIVNWKIAGYYELGHGNKILGWPTLASYNELGDNKVITSESGWMDISCVATGQYRFQGVFLGNDDKYYKFNDVVSISDLKEGKDIRHTLTDAVETPVEVTWMAQGNEFARNMTLGNRIVIPDGQPASCGNGRVFIGWSATEVNATNIIPTLVQTGDVVNGNATYYAVFAEHTASALYEAASVGFNHYTDDVADMNVSSLMDSLMAYDKEGIAEISGTNTFVGKNGVIIGSAKQTGWITLTLDKPVAIKKVIVNAGQYGSGDCVIRVVANNNLIGDVQAPAANMEFTARQSVVSNTIKIAMSNKGKRAYISSISIMTDGGIEGNYSTSCSGTATDSPVNPANTEGLILIQNSLELGRNETKQLTYVVAPYGHKSQNVNWVSSDPSVASVDANGAVTGVSAGTATITGTAVDGGYTATCEVIVNNKVFRYELVFNNLFEHKYNADESEMSIGLSGSGSYPYLFLRFHGDSTNWKIAGNYQLDGNNYISGWTASELGGGVIKSNSGSGWLNISCIESGRYRFQSEFTGSDGIDYKFDYTASVSDMGGNTLTDQVGDGILETVYFLSLGDTIDSTYLSGGTLVMPNYAPTNCSEMTFIGWTTTANYNSNSAPTFAKPGDASAANTNYYAVFAHENSNAAFTEVASVVFKDSTDVESWYDDEPANYRGDKKIEDLMVSHNNIVDVHGIYMRPGAHGLRIGSNTNEYSEDHYGYARFEMGQAETITKVVVTSSKTNSADIGKYNIDLGNVHAWRVFNCGENVVYIPEEPVTANEVNIATTGKAAYIKSVTIYTGGGFKSYTTTTCQAASASHTITVNTPTNGEAGTNVNAAEAGETVTITATPHHCYEVGSISVKDEGNNDITVTNNQFTMPDSNVTVTVNFIVSQYSVTATGEANGNAQIDEQ